MRPSKRVKDLEVGESFWFSGNWRKVIKKDETYLHYRYSYQPKGKSENHYHKDTLMVNSMMLVEIRDKEIVGPPEIPMPIERPPAIYSNKKHIV